MNNISENVAAIEAMLDLFWSNFRERPRMLGPAEELSSLFYYMDQVEYLLLGGDPEAYWKCSWNEFLVHKKLIVGARDLLKEDLRESGDGYERLQALRREYLTWRAGINGWPKP
jgi:hypothetical protein